jgi:hypothetical protein
MRLVVKYRESERFEHVNVTADKLVERDGIVWAYRQGELVAAIKTDVFDMAYLSGGE